MLPISPARRVAQVFLWLVPFVFIPLLSILFHASRSKTYLIAGAALGTGMLIAAWVLGFGPAKQRGNEQKWLAIAASLLMATMIAVSLFAGLGPPPQNHQEWLDSIVNQEIRYTLLIFVGLFTAAGLTVLRECLRRAGENFYSALGFASILICTTLYVLGMAGFLSVLPGALRQWAANGRMPDWFAPVWQHVSVLGMVAIPLTYLAVAAYVAALRSVGWMGKTASRVLVTLNVASAFLVVVSPVFPDGAKLGLPAFILAVPAVPYLMPYLIGIGLMRRTIDVQVKS